MIQIAGVGTDHPVYYFLVKKAVQAQAGKLHCFTYCRSSHTSSYTTENSEKQFRNATKWLTAPLKKTRTRLKLTQLLVVDSEHKCKQARNILHEMLLISELPTLEDERGQLSECV